MSSTKFKYSGTRYLLRRQLLFKFRYFEVPHFIVYIFKFTKFSTVPVDLRAPRYIYIFKKHVCRILALYYILALYNIYYKYCILHTKFSTRSVTLYLGTAVSGSVELSEHTPPHSSRRSASGAARHRVALYLIRRGWDPATASSRASRLIVVSGWSLRPPVPIASHGAAQVESVKIISRTNSTAVRQRNVHGRRWRSCSRARI